MPISNMIENTKVFFTDLKNANKVLTSAKSLNVNNQKERLLYEELAARWFSEFSRQLSTYGVAKDILNKYNNSFKGILKLSSGKNRRSSFIKLFDEILASFNSNIVIFLQTDAIEDTTEHQQFSEEVRTLLDKISDSDENEYLTEALGCWESGYLKAATVLLWCAAIDRIHKVIEKKGFDLFNNTSKQMKGQTTGRYKRFSKEYNIQNISELRTAFDNDILWVIEGMQLIDTNERTRLASCFDMRCHSGHPGDAPITKYNVLSCFSDIVEIVLSNPTFSLTDNK